MIELITVYVNGPLYTARSLMFLDFEFDNENKNVRSFLYANCAQQYRGACSTCYEIPSMSEWGILVRQGYEQLYHANNTLLSNLYDGALERASLPPVASMNITNYFQCDTI